MKPYHSRQDFSLIVERCINEHCSCKKSILSFFTERKRRKESKETLSTMLFPAAMEVGKIAILSSKAATATARPLHDATIIQCRPLLIVDGIPCYWKKSVSWKCEHYLILEQYLHDKDDFRQVNHLDSIASSLPNSRRKFP